MATTNFTSASPHAVKIWSRKAWSDAVKATMFGKLMGTGPSAIVQVKNELKKGPGDRIRFSLRALPSGLGVQDDEVLEGNEEGLDFKYFDINLGEKRHAIKVDLNLSAQRTMFDVRAEAKDALQEWLEEYLDTTFFEYLTGSGAGPAGASYYHPSGPLGGNALLAPSADRVAYGGTGNTAVSGIEVGDTMSLSVLDKVAAYLKLASPTIRKGSVAGKRAWVVIMHPYQVNDLRSNTNTGQWMDIQKAALQGGSGENSLFWGESLGMYRDMILMESTRVPAFTNWGAGAIQGARALVLGAQAAVVAQGQGTDDKGKLKLIEKTFDYEKSYGVSATLIWGMAKSRFDGQSDFGVFTIDTAAAAPA